MDRRQFLTLTGATLAVATPAMAEVVNYTPGLVQQRLQAGETLFLEFGTKWCSTCAAQRRTLTSLRDANPNYEQKITFVTVDYDKYGRSELATSLRIPRRSTLVVLKGDKELGRIVAGTRENEIKNLMDVALNA